MSAMAKDPGNPAGPIRQAALAELPGPPAGAPPHGYAELLEQVKARIHASHGATRYKRLQGSSCCSPWNRPPAGQRLA